MKTCIACKVEKDFSMFRKRKMNKDGLQNTCKVCAKLYDAKWYVGCKEDYKIRKNKHSKNRININRQYIWDYLKAHPCTVCGESDPIVLEFDHIDPVFKLENVSNMQRTGHSLVSIQTEIDKCNVLCANCHKRKTAIQFGFYKDIIR